MVPRFHPPIVPGICLANHDVLTVQVYTERMGQLPVYVAQIEAQRADRESQIGRTTKPMRELRTLDELTEQYFRDHPEEIDDYSMEIFQDFAEDNDTGALLASLRVLARVRGISDMAARIGMTRQGVQKALSDDGNPRLGNVTSIMKAMGYYLLPQKLPQPQ